MEERRRQREQEQARRREEEEREERRVALEREMLERRYELDTQRKKVKNACTHTQARSARFSTRLIFSTPSLNCFLSTSVLQEQLSHQAEQPHKDHDDDRHQEILEPSGEQSFCSVAAIQTKTHTVQKLAPRTWSRCFAP